MATTLASNQVAPSRADGTAVEDRLSPSLLALLSVSAALSVASLYYCQPLLAVLAKDLGVDVAGIGLIPLLSQVGYAIGLVFLLPLADRIEKRSLILWTASGLAVALLAFGLAPGFAALMGATLLAGILATVAQQIVAMAVALTLPLRRGRVLGILASSILIGILLARTASGALAAIVGWRVMFTIAAALVLVVVAVMALRLPRVAPSTTLGYRKLILSLVSLTREHPELRRAGASQMLLFGAFGAFWSVLAIVLAEPPYGMGSAVTGSFGVLGAAGALAATLVGRLTDRVGIRGTIVAGSLLVAVSFLLFGLFPGSLTVLIAGTVMMDLGVQMGFVANQTRVFGLDPGASGRLNTVFMSAMFVGGAGGAVLGTLAFAHAGMTGVALVGSVAGAVAIALLYPGIHCRRPESDRS